MKHWKILGLAFCALVLAPLFVVAQVPVIGPSTFTFSAAGQSNIWSCNTGQSSFALTVPSGLTATLTVTVSQTSGGTYVSPPFAYANGSTTFANTIANAGSLTVNLGSNQYVKVAVTSYTAGTAVVTGVCSSAVAAIPPQPVPSGLVLPTFAATAPLAFATPGGVYTYSCPGGAGGCVTGILAGNGVTVTPTASPGGNAYIIAIPTPTPYVCTGCITGVVAGSGGVTVTPTASPGGNAVIVSVATPTPYVPPTYYASFLIGLGFAAGTVSTSTTYPVQTLAHYTGGVLRGLGAACSAYDTTTVFNALLNGTSIGTITLGGAATETTFASPVPIPTSSPNTLTVQTTTAGTAANCAVAVRGYQQVVPSPLP